MAADLVTYDFSRLAYAAQHELEHDMVQRHFKKLMSLVSPPQCMNDFTAIFLSGTHVHAQAGAVLNKFTDGNTIDTKAITEGEISVAAAMVGAGRITVSTLAFVGMVALMPHIPEFSQLPSEVTITNPLHGTLYHYLHANFLCYGCENGMIPPLLGLGTAQGANGGLSECAKVKDSSERKLAALQKACGERGLTIPDYDNFFFKFHPSPGRLRGDPTSSSQASSSGVQAETTEEQLLALDGGGLSDGDSD